MLITRAAVLYIAAGLLLGGCASGPTAIPQAQQATIDRSLVEYPSGYRLSTIARNLTGPTAICFDASGNLIIAEAGMTRHPRIVGIKPGGQLFDIYPSKAKLPFGINQSKGVLYGPIGGMAAGNGKIYVLHHDEHDRGVLSAIDYAGVTETIAADLPTEGEHGVLDLVLNRFDQRLYFSIGSMTNSGVVGLDNWEQGWVEEHAYGCDIPAVPLKLLGYRFDTANPRAGILGGANITVTAPFQPFGVSNQMWVRPVPGSRPTAAIYSISTTGGDLRVEAHGVRCAQGLAVNDYGRLYATNQGMELRGTRPVKDDPDTVIRVVRNTWYGWPDYSADLQPITNHQFQPPPQMIIATGYPELSLLVDHESSGLIPPDRGTLLQATFRPLSGAAKMDFAPSYGAFRPYYGTAIVALSGDRAPFATSGQPLVGPIGYRVVRVDVDAHQVHDFVYNTRNAPASRSSNHPDALERPCDAKFGPDGALYILDLGQLEAKNARFRPVPYSGKILRLDQPPVSPTTK